MAPLAPYTLYCVACETRTTKQCSGCRELRICSPECQRLSGRRTSGTAATRASRSRTPRSPTSRLPGFSRSLAKQARSPLVRVIEPVDSSTTVGEKATAFVRFSGDSPKTTVPSRSHFALSPSPNCVALCSTHMPTAS
ncbi:hypothetical protein AAT19DRAFT_9740 [Rhodotorula toruloides]|uniref:Uncharacterized protein n=1 Tax=Rhodotorula toruloides TaxID=5286 RepID=A0A2T0A0U7_RHOTO|nr:hypothetical protein AAT19DRAFT_9740 [Rhodotorula toruloides]